MTTSVLIPAPTLILIPAPSTPGLIPTVSLLPAAPPHHARLFSPHTRESGYPSGDWANLHPNSSWIYRRDLYFIAQKYRNSHEVILQLHCNDGYPLSRV